MFACLVLSSSPGETPRPAAEPDALEMVARAFSPRVEVHGPGLVTLDLDGLQRLFGLPEEIARELQRDGQERGCDLRVAVAATRTAAMLLALSQPGVTVVRAGEERQRLAGLPLGVLRRLPLEKFRVPGAGDRADVPMIDLLRRWGLKTLGDLALLPSAALSARVGQTGLLWQRLARGEDVKPLVAMAPEAPIEETLDLDWPVEGLEPLSFVLPRLIEPICQRLERLDLAAVVLHLTFRLVSREEEVRRLPLPAPIRDPRALRTLVLLHLESHPLSTGSLSAGVDRLALRVETAPARILQFSLLARALPFPEQMATLLARLSALMGERRVGAADLVDSHRPGAFAMRPFQVAGGDRPAAGGKRPAAEPETRPGRHRGAAEPKERLTAFGDREPHVASREPEFPLVVLRRFRLAVPARVAVQDNRPVQVTTERRGVEGGRVEASSGPWRTSGEWWGVGDGHVCGERATPQAAGRQPHAVPWDRDEWDVALSDGAVYRIHHDRIGNRWFVDGIVD